MMKGGRVRQQEIRGRHRHTGIGGIRKAAGLRTGPESLGEGLLGVNGGPG